MFVYKLDLDKTQLENMSRYPEGIYDQLKELIPVNLDRRVFNNTIYHYFEQISLLPHLSRVESNSIRFQYMRYHNAPLYGDMDEVIYIPTYEGGIRYAKRGNFIPQIVVSKHDRKRK